ncbi:MAG TPA: hypothetical protein VGV09_20995 [Steroidobacteraceae bacterium]|nr:hypothetical protein [Steroidobacteraceae bacterium]
MAVEKSGSVSMKVDGKLFTGHYRLEDGVIHVSTEIGTLTKRYVDGSIIKHVAEQLLARLVREELKGS